MKSLIKLLLVLIFVVILGEVVLMHQEKYHPCATPITYSIGTFDTKFGISRESFLGAVAEAESIWEKPFGRDLFAYDAVNGEMKINLLYDYRQEGTSRLENLSTALKDNNSDYEALKKKYQSMTTEYNQTKASYEADLRSFNTRYKSYQDLVAYWNARGGAPKDEYDKIQASQPALLAELASLETREAGLSQIVRNINTLVANLNKLGANLNQTVAKYNNVGDSLGDSFEEGLYVNENGVKHIDIYEFNTHDELVRVLAHELGHSLGLDHVSDPSAIMYKLNQATNKNPSKADLVQLEAKCGTNL